MSEVLVVDDASTDLSLELCAQRFPEEPKLKIIRNAVNIGFAAACNIGIAQAGSYVLFLNPDCVSGKGSLPRMIQVLQTNAEVGIVGGLYDQS